MHDVFSEHGEPVDAPHQHHQQGGPDEGEEASHGNAQLIFLAGFDEIDGEGFGGG